MDTKPTYKELEQKIAKLEAQTQRYKEFDLAPIFKGIEKSFPMGITDQNGIMIYVNDPLVKMWGYSSEKEILGRGLAEFWESDGIFSTIDDLINTGWSMGEDIGRRKDGSLFNAEYVAIMCKDNNGEPLYMLGQFFDITKRKQTEKALQEAYSIINRSPAVAILWKNSEGWPVEFVSDNVRELFGYAAEEFTSGQVSYAMTIHPDDLERVAKEVTTFSNEKERTGFVHEPYRVIAKDGKVRWLDDRTYIRRDNEGNITHYEAIVVDITDSIQTAEHLRKDMVFISRNLYEVGCEGINFDTSASAGDADFYATLQAVSQLKKDFPEMAVEVGMSSEFVLGMHGEIQFEGKQLAGMYPHEQVKVVEAAGADIFGPAINVKSSESIPWNLARAVTFVKATVEVARIPVHPNVGMGVCGVPVFEVPPIDAVTRAAKSLVQIGKADGL